MPIHKNTTNICTFILYREFLFNSIVSSIGFFWGGWASQVALVKNPPATARDIRDAGSVPRSGRSPGEGNGNLIQYSCLENSMDRVAWWVMVHTITKSPT